MKRLALGIVAACCSFAAPAETGDRADLTHLEDVWNHSHLRSDAEALDRLWADDIEVAVPQMPVLNKDELVAFVRSGRMEILTV